MSAPPNIASAVVTLHRCVAQAGLGADLIGLARLRVAQIHRCDARIDTHFLSLIGASVSMEKLASVAHWRESGTALAPSEQATLAWAEALAPRTAPPISDALHQQIAAVLGHEQLVGLSLAIALENALSRTRWP
ncbi:hypothetical protein RT97_05330 [Variovorax paradoxus]|uniref:Carboxymuconolactone decarboxylase-like domain-containing protein n=1 Tax=Variovorax paradoxus TaxID=34073 RepID=A0A0D0MWM0_VARPD|nr:carboxymuconolactone decarboxylase family protein [Variovorax paradoxus]KIQ35324.1 hypothetical protein RT97_05330 [Variovorax paradoxus]